MNIKRILPILLLLLAFNLQAQRHKDKIKALKIAHITDHLDLTEQEAQAFWPIYNANEDAKHLAREKSDLRRSLKGKNSEDLTETEAKAFLDTMIKMEEERVKLQKVYYQKLQKVLSAKKIMKLMQADRSFRQKMIKEFKERHRGMRGEKGQMKGSKH